MAATLVNALVSSSGVSDPVGKLARLDMGTPTATNMRVSARTLPGNPPPPGEPPSVSIETSADGETWTTLVESAVADGEGIEAHAVFPVGNDLRVRWELPEPCFATTYWSLRVWVG